MTTTPEAGAPLGLPLPDKHPDAEDVPPSSDAGSSGRRPLRRPPFPRLLRLPPLRLRTPRSRPPELRPPGLRSLKLRPPQLRPLLVTGLPLTAILAVAALLRFWQLGALGLNSDEAVYAGTAASIGGDGGLRAFFPVFRAHPVLVQTGIALVLRVGHGDAAARALPALCGVLTVLTVYLLGRRLYGNTAGLISALLLAVMPYAVVVSRQVLLDGPMTLLMTVALYCVIRYAESAQLSWMLAAGGSIGAAVLAKETSVVLVGALYTFFALTPAIRLRWHHLLAGLATTGLIASVSPVVLSLSGRASTGQNYLLYQMFRRANHSYGFYASVVPGAVGWGVLALALLGLVLLRSESTWRERLLLLWITVPVAFFTLWPVKGYQYLLPIAPALALLAGRLPGRLQGRLQGRLPGRPTQLLAGLLTTAVVVSLAVPAWGLAQPSTSRTFLAGTGGLPGGREAGLWLHDHAPTGAQFLAIGPSMANVLEYYGRHRGYALSVSPNPADRNPAYVPVPNPDRALRTGQFQYLVWDSYTADRTPFYTATLQRLVQKYHGVAVFTATVPVRGGLGDSVPEPVVIIYQVRSQ